MAGQLAREYDRVRAVHLDQKGRGRALRSAWSTSDAAIVAYMDVDLSTDLDALLPLVASLVSGHSDIAIGSRLAPGASVARFPKREFISRAYNFLLRAVFATPVRDAQCGFKAVRADVARRLLPEIEDDGWFFDTELLLLARRNGLRIHEVPVDWVDDADSRVDVVGTARGDLAGVARMVRRFWSGGGRVELGDAARPALEDDFGRRLVVFSEIPGNRTNQFPGSNGGRGRALPNPGVPTQPFGPGTGGATIAPPRALAGSGGTPGGLLDASSPSDELKVLLQRERRRLPMGRSNRRREQCRGLPTRSRRTRDGDRRVQRNGSHADARTVRGVRRQR